MVIDHEAEAVVSGRVDQAKMVPSFGLEDGLKARSKIAVVCVGSVNGTVHRSRRFPSCGLGIELIGGILARSVTMLYPSLVCNREWNREVE